MTFFKMLGREYFPWTKKLIDKLSRPEYRGEYVEQGVKLWIARQIRALREQRDWSQADLADKTDKKQSAISRLEDPEYGQMTLQTLLELAKAYDVALVVKFVDFPTFVRETKDLSSNGMRVESFSVSSFAWGSANSIVLSPRIPTANISKIYDVDAIAPTERLPALPPFVVVQRQGVRRLNA